MLRVSDLMTAEVLTLDPDMSLRQAVERLEEGDVTGAPVVASGRVVGVVSQTDVLDFHASTPGVPTAETREGVPEDWGGAEIMGEEDAEEAPSTYFARLWSDSQASLTERFEDPDTPEWDILEEHTVAEVMTRRVVAVRPSASVEEAARTMLAHDVHRILVMEGDRLQGILSSTDLMRAVAEGRLRG